MRNFDQIITGQPEAPKPHWLDWLTAAQRRSVGFITLGAIALFVVVRLLPTGTNLNHMDFRVEGKGALEFCDPANPQFIPVVSVRSPVALTLRSDHPPAQYQPVRFVLSLRTASGKPIAPEDLVVAHTRKLHLMVVDPTLTDYQHVHPEPGRKPGDWEFSLTPARTGTYRVFADFTPVATGRGLYASADFEVPGPVAKVTQTPNSRWQDSGLNFELEMPPLFKARQPTDLVFHVTNQGADHDPVPLQPVMGAFAHLVAFDVARSGFAHLHPKEIDLSKPPDPVHPTLHFKVTIPTAGRYVIWAQVKVHDREVYAPFWIDVL
ncbi:MAG TPA: hypothetical protein VL200_14935 [Lacunisphaera sp.]|jgi:hypothetical protein|nr:hypothetical protein [Lacunisphaera sp.]